MTTEPRKAILILGMHRSGTSMLTRVCNLLGAELGAHLLPPVAGNNDSGFWENADIVALHDALLARMDRIWSSTHPLPAGWWESKKIAPLREKLARLLTEEFGNAALWCVKDPRLCRLLPLWQAILKEQGVEPAYVHIIRHPAEVAASLKERDGIEGEQAMLLWLQHVVEAEEATRGVPRLFVSYDAVLDDWKQVTARIGKEFGIRWPVPNAKAEAEISAFLDPSLRHHGAGKKAKRAAMLPWVEEAYDALSSVLEAGEDDAFRATLTTLSARLAEAEINLAAWWMAHLSASEALAEMRQAHGALSAQHHETNLRHAEALDALADARHRLIETTDRLNAIARESITKERQMQQMNERLRDITTSFTWRWASKLRFTERFVEALLTLLLRTPVAFEVVAEIPDGSRAAFELHPKAGRFPSRWVELAATLAPGTGEAYPMLALDDSLKSRESVKIVLPVMAGNRIHRILRLPDHVQAARLYTQNGARPARMTWTPITRSEALVRLFAPRIRAKLSQPGQAMAALQRFIDVTRQHGLYGLKTQLRTTVLTLTGAQQQAQDPAQWFEHYRPDDTVLSRMRNKTWPSNAPVFTLLLPVSGAAEARLQESIESLRHQIYGHWELLLIREHDTPDGVRQLTDRYAHQEPRVHLVESGGKGDEDARAARGLALAMKQAQGDYVQILAAGDVLEPQALFRYAAAITQQPADLLYADEAITGESSGDVRDIIARACFSYDHFLCYPAMTGPVMLRRTLAEEVGGIDPALAPAHVTDLVLRALEREGQVTHIPDILQRRHRILPPRDTAAAQRETEQTRKAIAQHLARINIKATVENGRAHGFYDVRYRRPAAAKVAIVIPTKNRVELLRPCLESLARTVDPKIADIYVLDHDSQEAPTRAYLDEISTTHTVIPYQGIFNFSAINNHAIHAIKKPYSHYLLLNNDIEALEPGWLEHMLQLCCRPDVGVVGAVLHYPIRTIQHAGVVVGLFGGAEHAHKGDLPQTAEGIPNPGYNGSLLATRDYSAVTAACLLIKSGIFHRLNGMDETLAVGFGDVDLCLRAEAMGYKVLLDAQAVLLHYESVSRGKSEGAQAVDPHPEDSRRYIARYKTLIEQGDPYYSPLLAVHSNRFEPNPFARAQEQVASRSAAVRLPNRGPEQSVATQDAA